MFDSKSPVVKIAGYFILGFFGFIIIISFGMPDFVSKIGLDNTTAAVINGEKIHAFEYFRFRDRYRDSLSRDVKDKKNFEDIVFKNFVGEILLLQKTKELGFDVTEERIFRTIRGMKEFQNPNTGKFDYEIYKLILRNNRLNSNEFAKFMRTSMLKEDFFKIMQMGVAVSRDDILTDYMADRSKIQIRYSFLPRTELEKRFSRDIAVADSEIADELTKNPKEVKDPKTDKERIKNKLVKKKLDDTINGFVARINAESEKKGSFEKAAGILKGSVGESAVFKIGDEVIEKGKEGKPLTELSNSKIFRETCLALKKGDASKVIESPAGLYIFTPILLEVESKAPGDSEFISMEKLGEYERLDSLTRNLMASMSEKSKIVKNLKTD